MNAVQRAAGLLGYQNLRIVNLLNVPTRNSGHVVELGATEEPWLEARHHLSVSLLAAADLLFAWGLLHHLGLARSVAKQQVDWLLDLAVTVGHQSAWAVGHDVRHPSRWHQYTSDRYGRTGGGSADERLRAVLLCRPLSSYRSRPGVRRIESDSA